MSDEEKTPVALDEETDAIWAEAAAKEEKARKLTGHAEDGNYVCLETDLDTGEQAMISIPDLKVPMCFANGVQMEGDNGDLLFHHRLLMFPSAALWESWVEERGAQGFGYLIFRAVHGRVGKRTGTELREIAEKDKEFSERDSEASAKVTESVKYKDIG